MEQSSKKRVVIIEDERSVAELYSEFCRSFGFDTLLLRGSKNAMQEIGYYKPDLILLDIIMPGIMGTDLLKLIRANKATADIPVILLSSFVDSDEVDPAVKLSNAMLAKPVNLQTLKNHIEKLLPLEVMQ